MILLIARRGYGNSQQKNKRWDLCSGAGRMAFWHCSKLDTTNFKKRISTACKAYPNFKDVAIILRNG